MTLAGKQVVNTRASHQAAELDRLLREHGAQPIDYPCIDIAPPDDPAPLDSALSTAAAGRFDWLVLTSANTVIAVARRLDSLRMDGSALATMQVAAIGPATADAARDVLGLQVALIPAEYTARTLAEALQTAGGESILLPQSSIAKPALATDLTAAGLAVAAVPAYQTVIGSGGADVPALLAARRIQAITFTSSSTVTNFVARLSGEGGRPDGLDGVCVACIGPSTADTARDNHLPVSVIPEAHTLDGMVAGLESYFLEVIETP